MLAAALLVLPLTPLVAQEAPPAAAEAPQFKAEVASGPKEMTLLDLYIVGGWCMHPLLLMSIAGVTLAIRNHLALKPAKLLREDLLPALRQHLADRDVFSARDLCKAQPTLLTSMLGAGLERVTSDSVELSSIKEAIDEAAAEQVTMYMRPISFLSVIGTVAPMVGLLGTVSGMIKAFQNMSAGGMGKPEILASNIGEALITTAAGLIIAIPVMIAYFYYKNSFIKSMATAGRMIGVLMNTLRTGEATYMYTEDVPAAAPADAAAQEEEGAGGPA
jgi:biopolymer transport protein ExbB